jgi:hypothetical protein
VQYGKRYQDARHKEVQQEIDLNILNIIMKPFLDQLKVILTISFDKVLLSKNLENIPS